MESISLQDYIELAYNKGYPKKQNWFISMFTEILSPNEFITPVGNGVFKVKTSDLTIVGDEKEFVTLEGTYLNKPILTLRDVIELPAGFIENLKEDVATTHGRLYTNYLLTIAFGKKINYINKQFSFGEIEDEIVDRLVSNNDPNEQPDDITVSEYEMFTTICFFIENKSQFINYGATVKSVIPPTGIDEYKKKLLSEMSEDDLKDYIKVANLESKLLEFDKEFLKDDPTFGKNLTKKILGNSRKNTQLMVGARKTFGHGSEAKTLLMSLNDGYGTDPEEFVEVVNEVRSGSFNRGKETAKGGETAKIILRTTGSLEVVEGDCGSKKTMSFTPTKDTKNQIVGRNIVTKNGLVEITKKNANEYIGEEIQLRSPIYCSHGSNSICSVCGGKNLKENPFGIPNLVMEPAGIAMYIPMKAMHDSTVKKTTFTLEQALS
jgi:hypothetical protein